MASQDPGDHAPAAGSSADAASSSSSSSFSSSAHSSKHAQWMAEVEKVRRRILSEAADLQAQSTRGLAGQAVSEAKERVQSILKDETVTTTVTEAKDRVTSMVTNVLSENEPAVAEARVKVQKMMAEAAALAELQAQSAETMALLARDDVQTKLRGSQEDIVRWQAQVVSSVEERVLSEFDGFVKDLEPSLRQSGRQVSLSALGFMGPR